MATQDSRDNLEGDVRRARENVRAIVELKEKMEILTEHVESRKQALDEEIEEGLHEAIRNARDSQEKIQENIKPKLEKVIQQKLEVIDKKMARLQEDGLEAVRQEIKNATPEMSKKVLWDLDQTIVNKVKLVKGEIIDSLKEEVDRRVKSELEETREKVEKARHRTLILSVAALGLAALAVLMVVFR